MITFKVTGSTKKMDSFLAKMLKLDIKSILNSCGREGVSALSSATPVDSGIAAHSWSYEVSSSRGKHEIVWKNSDVENGFPVVIMLQYGHGTGTGGYIQGRDFINPAMKPIFDKISDEVRKAVTSA